jgi:hypothetical protein
MKGAARAAVAAGLAFGLAWLLYSARYALASGYNADVVRQWTVSQYVRAGIDPYKVSLDILRLNFGEMTGTNRMRLKDLVIYEVHPHFRSDGVENILPEYGPPTSTYPPSSLFLLVFTIGAWPREVLHGAWLAVNLFALAWLIFSYARASRADLLATAALLLLWPPTHELIRTSQFGLPVMVWLLAALRRFGKDQAGEVLFFTLVLLKPSMVLPLFALPLVRGRWLTLAVAGGLHIAFSFALAGLVETPLPQVLGEWLKIPGYMLQGAYTVQEFINRLGLDNTPAGTGISLAVAGIAGLWCLIHRKADPWRQAALLSFAALLWTYHERYDFILVLIPMRFAWMAIASGAPLRRSVWIEIAAYVALGLALTDAVYLSDHPIAWAVRWAGRLALLALTVHAAWMVRRDALQPATAP